MIAFGEQIKQAREKKNLSQEELAELMKVSRQSISKWENDLSVPQGENRRRLIEVLELKLEVQNKAGEENAEDTIAAGNEELVIEKNQSADNPHKSSKAAISGWLVAVFLLTVLAASWVFYYQNKKTDDETGSQIGKQTEDFHDKSQQTEKDMPAWKEILFYDNMQAEVTAGGISYNAAKIDSILVQWDGDGAKSIDMYYVPVVADVGVSEEKTLLLTQKIPDHHSAILLDGERLGSYLQGQIYFELKFEGTILISEKYSFVYDPTIMAYIKEFDGKNIVFDEVEWVDIPSERAAELELKNFDAGFEVYNEKDELTDLVLSDECVCTVLDWMGDYQKVEVTPEELADILREREGLAIPYTLLIQNNEVVSISERYVP